MPWQDYTSSPLIFRLGYKKRQKKQIELFLAFWIINLVIPWINFFAPTAVSDFSPNGNYYWEFCYFGGFLGYWILGYYLNKYPIRIGVNPKFLFLSASFVLYPAAIYLIKSKGLDASVLTDNLQIGSAVLVALLYTIMQNLILSSSVQQIITKVAKYSYGIYLTHIYIARELYWGVFNGTTIHIFPRTFMIALLTLLTGYLISYLLAKLPKGKYITGT